MALSKDFEIPGTGVTVPNAYFIVDEIRVEKRMADFPYPGMDLTDEQRVEKGEYDFAYMNPVHYTFFSKSTAYRAFARQKRNY